MSFPSGNQQMPRQVAHVATAIKRDFMGLISMDDYLRKGEGEKEQAFLSREIGRAHV